jgi:hypothetical protein
VDELEEDTPDDVMAQTGTEKKKSIKVYVTRLTEWRTFWPYYLQ